MSSLDGLEKYSCAFRRISSALQSRKRLLTSSAILFFFTDFQIHFLTPFYFAFPLLSLTFMRIHIPWMISLTPLSLFYKIIFLISPLHCLSSPAFLPIHRLHHPIHPYPNSIRPFICILPYLFPHFNRRVLVSLVMTSICHHPPPVNHFCRRRPACHSGRVWVFHCPHFRTRRIHSTFSTSCRMSSNQSHQTQRLILEAFPLCLISLTHHSSLTSTQPGTSINLIRPSPSK